MQFQLRVPEGFRGRIYTHKVVVVAVAVAVAVVAAAAGPAVRWSFLVEGSNPYPELLELADRGCPFWAGNEPCRIGLQTRTVFGSQVHIGRIHDSRSCSSYF